MLDDKKLNCNLQRVGGGGKVIKEECKKKMRKGKQGFPVGGEKKNGGQLDCWRREKIRPQAVTFYNEPKKKPKSRPGYGVQPFLGSNPRSTAAVYR